MTKQQLREAIRKIIRQELAEDSKNVPNPNASNWRIVGLETGNIYPNQGAFYGTKEEAQAAASKLGRIKDSGIKYVQLKDTMKMSENAPAPSKPTEKPGPAIAPGKPGEKERPRRELVPKPVTTPIKNRTKRSATMEEANMVAQIIKRFKSKK